MSDLAAMTIADTVLPAAAPRDAHVAMTSAAVPVVILGAGGYVGGELLRLLAFHPRLQLAAAVSGPQAGEPIASVFPHLSGVYARTTFAPASDPEALVATGDDPTRPLAVFAALPHGRSAATVDALLTAGERAGRAIALVDLSADFRLADATVYAEVYGRPHAAPARLASFHCGLPDLGLGRPAGPVAHPGCFTTAVTLAAWPLLAMGLASPRLVASAVTGSTGSGREPAPGTHHPDRHGDMKACAPLSHRHRVEMERLLGRALRVWAARLWRPLHRRRARPRRAERRGVAFIPHSGPFARGIHATVVGRLREAVATGEDSVARFAALYQATPFVSVAATPPRLKEVVGTNRCHLGIAAAAARWW